MIVALEFGLTVINVVSIPPQLPEMVYEIINVPTPDEEGVNVPATESVIPVPDHIPPGLAALKLNATLPSQTDATSVMVASVDALTDTVETAVPVQPLVVPVTVYVVVDAGLTEIGFVRSPVLQAYVVPPPAVSVAEVLGQIVSEFTVTTGIGVTVTVEIAVLVQPPVVPVTVYEVVEAGETDIGFMIAPVLQT